MKEDLTQRSGVVERHVQTVMISIITAGIVFAATYFYDDNREKGEVKAQLGLLTGQVIELRSDVKAMQQNFVNREELSRLESRVRELERQKR